MSPLVLGEILGLFLNTLTGDDQDPVQDWENLKLPIQMQLPEKWKSFSEFFVPLLDATSNFNHFERKDAFHFQFISEIADCENLR